MPRLRPFTGHLVAASRAHAVVAPPYDALTPEQRIAMAAADPESFLNALPPAGPDAPQDLDATLEACRRSVERLVADGRFTPLVQPVLAVVALGSGPRRAVAVVGDLPVEAFDLEGSLEPGLVRPHERVGAARVDQLTRYLDVVGVASSPVAVTHRPHADVVAATEPVLTRTPQLAFQGEDGVDLAVWIVEDDGEQQRLLAAIEAAGTLYIADGHHRAAALRAHARARDADATSTAGRVLTALIPSDHLAVLPFHRRILGVPDRSAETVLRRLRTSGMEPVELDGPWGPDRPGVVALTVSGRWWSLDLRDRRQEGPVEGLDVLLVERELVPALLAGNGPAGTVQLEPVAAPAGLAALQVPGAIGVALPPPGVDAILAVADAGAVMPPKTTYVTPKLRSGMFLVPR